MCWQGAHFPVSVDGKGMKKLLDLTPECVRQLNIEAAKKGTVFKLLAEKILEDYAQKLLKKQGK